MINIEYEGEKIPFQKRVEHSVYVELPSYAETIILIQILR